VLENFPDGSERVTLCYAEKESREKTGQGIGSGATIYGNKRGQIIPKE